MICFEMTKYTCCYKSHDIYSSSNWPEKCVQNWIPMSKDGSMQVLPGTLPRECLQLTLFMYSRLHCFNLTLIYNIHHILIFFHTNFQYSEHDKVCDMWRRLECLEDLSSTAESAEQGVFGQWRSSARQPLCSDVCRDLSHLLKCKLKLRKTSAAHSVPQARRSALGPLLAGR